jgi:Uma2 family endonuclease
MAPPLLVIEIVSPGELQRDRDYIAKRSQYQDLGIPEYWIVDPQEKSVLVLKLNEATYTEINTFKGNDSIQSPQFEQLNVAVGQIFATEY